MRLVRSPAWLRSRQKVHRYVCNWWCIFFLCLLQFFNHQNRPLRATRPTPTVIWRVCSRLVRSELVHCPRPAAQSPLGGHPWHTLQGGLARGSLPPRCPDPTPIALIPGLDFPMFPAHFFHQGFAVPSMHSEDWWSMGISGKHIFVSFVEVAPWVSKPRGQC